MVARARVAALALDLFRRLRRMGPYVSHDIEADLPGMDAIRHADESDNDSAADGPCVLRRDYAYGHRPKNNGKGLVAARVQRFRIIQGAE